MTKTLTEQWKNGELAEGWYYTIIKGFTDKEMMMIDYYIPELHHFEIKPSECIKEVLAPVPSYDEHNELKQDNKYLKSGIETRDKQIEQLKKKLEIATKALKKLTRDCNKWGIAREALKEMEGVK